MPWLLPALVAAQIFGILLADRGWLGCGAATAAGGLAAAVAIVGARRPGALVLAALLLAGAAGGLALGRNLARAEWDATNAPSEYTLEATVGSVAVGLGGYRVDLVDIVAVDEAAPPAPERVRLYGLPTPPGLKAFEGHLPGERIRARVRLDEARELRNPGARSRRRSLARAGIGAAGRLTHPALHARLPGREGLRPLAWVHARRADWGKRMGAAGAGGGLLRALALGAGNSLSPSLREAFASLGIAHLLAVSGLHLALVAALAFAVVRTSLGRAAWLAARCDTRLLAVAGALLAACGYAAMAGGGVPVRRALVLLLALSAAVAGGRARAALPPLAAAALAILCAEPEALFQPGAQLSFAASLALLAAARRAPSPPLGESRPRRWLESALRASASAVAVTAPLAAVHLGRSAPFALLVNLVAVPWTALLLLPAAFVATVGAALPPGGLGDTCLAGATAVAAATGHLVEAAAARLPHPIASGALSLPLWGVVVALALASFAAVRTRTRVLLAASVTAIIAMAPPPELPPALPRFVVLDVGQGDASVLQGRDFAILTDAGTAVPGVRDLGSRAVLPALAALGIQRLDLVIVTHADLDHRGGIPAVLAAMPVAQVWLPFGAGADAGFAAVRATAAARGVPVLERGAGSAPSEFGELRVTPLWPPPGAPAGSRNDGSLVVRCDVGDRRVLLLGDIEAASEQALVAAGVDLRADVVALAHHGSRSSSTAAFLAAVDAAVAVVSAPCGGRFAMPHPEVLARTRARSLPVWWTGRDGAVMIGLGRPLTVFGSADLADPPPRACRSDP